jgi:hypothetical protein
MAMDVDDPSPTHLGVHLLELGVSVTSCTI